MHVQLDSGNMSNCDHMWMHNMSILLCMGSCAPPVWSVMGWLGRLTDCIVAEMSLY